MKKGIVVSLIIVFIGLFSQNLIAQNTKVAHLDYTVLVQDIPGRDSVEQLVQAYGLTLQNDLASLENQLQIAYEKYMIEKDSLSDMMRQVREEEITGMQARIQAFSQSANEQLMAYQQKVSEPLVNRINETIKEVAKEEGYLYVLDSSKGGNVLFSDESVDIIDLVRKKLNIVK